MTKDLHDDREALEKARAVADNRERGAVALGEPFGPLEYEEAMCRTYHAAMLQGSFGTSDALSGDSRVTPSSEDRSAVPVPGAPDQPTQEGGGLHTQEARTGSCQTREDNTQPPSVDGGEGQAAAKELPPEMRELFGLKLNN